MQVKSQHFVGLKILKFLEPDKMNVMVYINNVIDSEDFRLNEKNLENLEFFILCRGR